MVLVLLLVVALGGGKADRPKPKKREPAPSKVARVPTRDWYSEGVGRGLDWKERLKNRKMPYTRAEALETAELMTSDYSKQGIDSQGEKDFIRGFTEAVLGQ